MDLARAPRRARLTARKKGSGYENVATIVRTLARKRDREEDRVVLLYFQKDNSNI